MYGEVFKGHDLTFFFLSGHGAYDEMSKGHDLINISLSQVMVRMVRCSKVTTSPFLFLSGHGAYGEVFKGRDLINGGDWVALKKIRIRTSADEGMPFSTIREIASLRKLEEHRNIVK